MSVMALTRPERKIVNRSELRQKQSATLRMARGNQVVVISANHEEDEKLLLDKKYFDEIMQKLRAVIETLEITSDQKLFKQILGVAETLEEDTRLGRLHSFEEAFGKE
jgi:phosphotransferase system IIB component